MSKNKEEVLKILSLIEEKIITAEDGKELIKAIGEMDNDFIQQTNKEKEKIKNNLNKFSESCSEQVGKVKDTIDPKVKNTLNSIAEALDKMAEKLYTDDVIKEEPDLEEELNEYYSPEEDILDLERLDGVEEIDEEEQIDEEDV